MDTSRLAKRLARLQERKGGGSGKNIFFKAPDDGKKATVRLVPYPHDENNEPFLEIGWHYNVGGHRSLVCPRETYGDPCPVCELAEQFRNMGGKDNWRIFKNLSPKLRYYSPVIVRGSEDEGIKLWGYGTTIYEDLISKFMDPDWGNLADPMGGRDVKVWTIPKGAAGNDTDFAKPKMDVSPSQSQMLSKKSDMKTLIENIPDYLGDGESFKAMSYQELQEIVAKMADFDEDDSSEDNFYSSDTTETEVNNTSPSEGSLEDKLSALFKDD